MSNEQAVEKEIQEKGLTAPRVTPEAIDQAIVGVYYFTADEGTLGAAQRRGQPVGDAHEELRLLTFCVLVLRNGFTVIGESACASKANFNRELGEKIAKDNARAKIWPLMGYALRDKLAEGRVPGY